MQIKEKAKRFKEKIDDKYLKITQSNIDFVKKICARSVPSFNENYWLHGSHYHTCLQVFDFADTSQPYMLQGIYSLPYTLITLDVEHVHAEHYEKDIQKLINTSSDNLDTATGIKKFRDNAEIKKDSFDFFNYINTSGDSVKNVTLRIYIIADNLEQLQKRVRTIEDILRSGRMCGYIQVNDLERDFRALTKIDNSVKKMVSSTTATDLSMYKAYNLIDANVGILGETINGVIAFDPFNFRYSSYSIAFFGDLGSGKSSHIKAMIEDGWVRGDLFHIIDVHKHEYYGLAKKWEKPYVSFSENLNINPCQIFFIYNDEESDNSNYKIREIDVSLKVSLITGIIEKIGRINKQQNLSLVQLSLLLSKIYNPYIGKDIRDLDNDDWFTLSDVLSYLQNYNYKEEEKEEFHILEVVLKDAIGSYGHMFDRKTNLTIDMDESCVYDISFLEFEKNQSVVSAYKQMIMDFIHRAVSYNGDYNKRMAEKMGISLENHDLPRPIRGLTIIEDEFGNDLNDRAFLDYNVKIQRISRKSYSGIWYVLHTTEDVMRSVERNGDVVQTIVGLCATKIIGKTVGNGLYKLRDLIPMLDNQDIAVIESLAKKEKGDGNKRKFYCVNALGQKMKYSTIITNRQREYFRGGV